MYHSENPFLCNIKQVKSNTTQKRKKEKASQQNSRTHKTRQVDKKLHSKVTLEG
jgi:hypothetical protein